MAKTNNPTPKQKPKQKPNTKPQHEEFEKGQGGGGGNRPSTDKPKK